MLYSGFQVGCPIQVTYVDVPYHVSACALRPRSQFEIVCSSCRFCDQTPAKFESTLLEACRSPIQSIFAGGLCGPILPTI